jgi:DNA-binding NarL/FixJ family response regulator
MTHHGTGASVRTVSARDLDAVQMQLLELLACGRTTRDAAAALELAPRTAERRLADARATLGARTTAQAVALALQSPRRPAPTALSARERDALSLVAHGLTSREIARRSGRTSGSVDALVRTALAKIGARTRVQGAGKLAGFVDERRPPPA